jgi:hypothetical protein
LGIVNVIEPNGCIIQEEIIAAFCPECHLYYVFESDFIEIVNKGHVMCEVYDYHEYMRKYYYKCIQNSFAEKSPLMCCGYNVKEGDLTRDQRQAILKYMIDSDILCSRSIISYLKNFIELRKYEIQYIMAIARWEEDIEFVQEYVKTKKMEKVDIDSIVIGSNLLEQLKDRLED